MGGTRLSPRRELRGDHDGSGEVGVRRRRMVLAVVAERAGLVELERVRHPVRAATVGPASTGRRQLPAVPQRGITTTWCATTSLLVQVIVVPTFTVSAFGMKV